MDHEILQEVTELVRKKQGGKRGPVSQSQSKKMNNPP